MLAILCIGLGVALSVLIYNPDIRNKVKEKTKELVNYVKKTW